MDANRELNGRLPLKSYSTILVVYPIILSYLERSGKKSKQDLSWSDMLLLGTATHKVSRLLTKEKVTLPLRAPFTEIQESAGKVEEKPKRYGMRRTLGELLTCPFCMDVWVATAITYAAFWRPRETKQVAEVFTIVTIADFLNFSFVALKRLAKSSS